MGVDNYSKHYANLNPAQKKAVDTIEGPVMVVAGPGTGKTQILTLRIANILRQTDIPADAILALTFTEAAAANMRKRLVNLIGSRGYYVSIHTFHGFCNRLIQNYPEYFPKIVGAENASEVDQIDILRNILDASEFEYLTPFGDKYFYIGDLLQAIRHLKKEGFAPEEFDAWISDIKLEFDKIPDLYHEKGAHRGKMKGEYRDKLQEIEKQSELARVYRSYQDTMFAKRLYDYEDMILAVLDGLSEKEDFLLTIQERYQYFLIDEHQDTNGAQNKIIELLASFYENPNLFVVGDEKQAIYRFQGASLENFLYFERKFPQATLIKLTDNYRSTQTILDSAQSVIDKNRVTLPNPLLAKKGLDESKINLVSFESPQGEMLFLGEKIKDLIATGTLPEEIAILYRDNRDSEHIAEVLERSRIPFVIESDEDLLRDASIQKLLTLFRAVSEFGSEEIFIQTLHLDFLEIDPLDVYKLVENREHRSRSIFSYFAQDGDLKNLDLSDPEKLIFLYEKMKRWRKASKTEPCLFVMEMIMRESGYLAKIISESDAFQKMTRLNVLFSEAKKIIGGRSEYRLADFIHHLQILRDHHVAIRPPRPISRSMVRLMTAHRAKGLEFDAVFVTGLTDGHWGNRRNPSRFQNLPFRSSLPADSLEKNEDERRLFYMAMTRARAFLYLTYTTHGIDGRELIPSQFVGEIDPGHIELRTGTKFDEQFRTEPELNFRSKHSASPSLKDKEFLVKLFDDRGFTATALNNYLECPWKFFYENLVRIPRAYNRSQVFGSAIHGSLQKFFEARAHGEKVGGDFLKEKFDLALRKFPIKAAEIELVRKKGEEILPMYFERYKDEWNYHVKTEYRIDGVMFEGVRLNGILDKIEITPDPRLVAVVDYKTGKPKSRGEIEGKTKDANGNYKRQLVFYKLLLKSDGERKLEMESGAIDFVEPNERGIFKKEIFEIGEEEVADLQAQIKEVISSIKNLSFWDKFCDDRECGYCALRRMMA